MTLRIRWLGTVPYDEALDLQRALHQRSPDDHLLLLEHPHVYTLGVRADPANVLVDPATVGAQLVTADRGGDVTYHGPGQLVGYPILTVAGKRGGGMADSVAYVRSVEQLVIDALAALDIRDVGRLPNCPGVWFDPDGPHPRKVAAVGVRLNRARTMHGFALNVAPDMAMFGHIVPCGIVDKPVTSLAAEGFDVSLQSVVDAIAESARERWGRAGSDRADVVWRERPEDLAPFSRGEGPGEAVGRDGHTAALDRAAVPSTSPVQVSGRLARRLSEAGVGDGLAIDDRKPDHVKARFKITDDYIRLERTMRDLDLVTVCQEAGCPNIFECWADGTATFMVGGERCTRRCGFCLVDTRHPEPLDADEPARVAEAVERMELTFAVLTMVARDDLDDGAAGHVAATISAIRERVPGVGVEALVSDLRGRSDSLATVLAARPDVLNHNVETVPRLQRAVRPSAGYARSLTVLARSVGAGVTTKSSLIVGMGERDDEVVSTLADLAAVGVDIVTIGQYLRPTTNHLPVARWVAPEQFLEWKSIGEAMGIGHVEASPLTRSSHHARQAADAVRVEAPTLSPPARSTPGPG